MKIFLQARFLLKPDTGIGQYSCELIRALSKEGKKNHYVIAVPQKIVETFPANVEILVIPEIKFGSAGFRKTWWEQVQIVDAVRKINPDLAHFFYAAHPWKRLGVPSVITVHDTIPWDNPAYRPSIHSKLYQCWSRYCLKRAAVIVSVSETTAKRIRELNKNYRIEVIWNGVNDLFYEKFSEAVKSQISHKYKLKRPYILYVGGYDVRKNVIPLIKAYSQAIAPKYDIDLVLAGEKSHKTSLYQSFDYEPAAAGVRRGKIMRIGSVPENDLASLYQTALFFVNISGAEGFNMPLIEAAASGKAIITSDIAVHHEILDLNALFVDANNLNSVTFAMQKLISDSRWRQDLERKALMRARQFSWSRSAREYLKIYEEMGRMRLGNK